MPHYQHRWCSSFKIKNVIAFLVNTVEYSSFILYNYGTGMIQVWYRYDTGMVQVWYMYGTSMVQVCYRYGTGMVQVWYRYGTCTVVYYMVKILVLCMPLSWRGMRDSRYTYIYSWFHIKDTWSVHSFNEDYLSISKCTGSREYLFHEIPST